MFAELARRWLSCLAPKLVRRKTWTARTLVVGPVEPVDGDSVACTRALVDHLRARGLEAFTLPTVSMHRQLDWLLTGKHMHPASLVQAREDLTTSDLQAAYDAMLEVWRPTEIVLVDGGRSRLGFDPRGVHVFVIDHHVDHGVADDADAFIQPAPAAGVLLIKHFGIYDPVLAVSILTDTFWLRQNKPAKAIEALAQLRRHGLTDEQLIEMQRRLFVPKDPEIVESLHRSRMRRTGEAVFVVLDCARPDIHRGVMGELGYFYRHICVVRADGYVSFRTTNSSLDLRPLADRWSGGGHPGFAAGRVGQMSAQVLEKLETDFLSVVGS